MIRKSFVVIVIQVFVLGLYAQTPPEFPSFNYNLIPPSPEVSALGKFANQNVSYATGKPQISIPIYTIQCGQIAVPISIDYSPGGIKVEEMSSTAGLGWALSAGGMISRTVVGMADDYPSSGYLDNEQYAPEALYELWEEVLDNPSHPQYNTFSIVTTDILSGYLDVEPDMFFYNLPGKGGKFLVNNHDKKAYPLAFEKISIEYDRSPAGGLSGEFSRWIVTVSDGTRYVFGRNMQDEATVFVESNENIRTDVRAQQSFQTTAWFLREIISANNADTVRFNYIEYNTSYCNKLSITKRHHLLNTYLCLPAEEMSTSKNVVTSYLIESINGRFGKVSFSYDNSRLDLYGGKILKEIKVEDVAANQVKKFVLKHSYFLSNGNTNTTESFSCPVIFSGDRNYRLKLDTVKQVDAFNDQLVHSFEYDYNEVGRILPDRLSNSQDHWGYYNGVNNITLIPRYPLYPIIEPLPSETILGGAKRNPVENYTTIGSLKTIKYPTGGRTEFEYELNEAYTSDFIHEVGLPNEDIPYITYATVSSNPVLDPNYVGFTIFSDPFTVSNQSYRSPVSFFQVVFNHPNYGDCDYDTHGDKPCRVGVDVVDDEGEVVFPVSLGTKIQFINNGTYRLRMRVINKTEWSADVVAYIKGPQELPRNYNKKIGGLRIKRIKDFDGINTAAAMVKEFKYIAAQDTTSSGRINLVPSYHSVYLYASMLCTTDDILVRTANSNLPLTSFSGSAVTYDRVEAVQIGVSQNQRSVFYFTNEVDEEGGSAYYPFPAGINLEHRRGLPLLEEHFKQTLSGYELVSSKKTNYKPWCINSSNDNPICPNMKWHYGLKTTTPGFVISEPYIPNNPNLKVNLYRQLTEWIVPIETISKTFAGPSDSLEEKITYDHEKPSHGLTTKSTAFVNNGEKIITEVKYTEDYSNLSSATDVQSLAIKNIGNRNAVLPVEKLIIKKDAVGNEFVTGGSMLFYNQNKTSLHSIYSLQLKAPVPIANFTRSAVNGSGVFIKDSRYQRIASYFNYDNYGNAIDMGKEYDIHYSHLFDYQGLLPICQVKNAAVSDIAYTSFEADGKGNWSGITAANCVSNDNTIMGKRHYEQNNFSISKSGLSSSVIYKVIYWRNSSSPYSIAGTISGWPQALRTVSIGGQEWTCFEHRVTGQTTITVTGSGAIDDLRLHPNNAQMATYSYNPLVGVSSQSDIANKIVYYEYDGFGRLKFIRDQEKKILKAFDYKYQQNTNQ